MQRLFAGQPPARRTVERIARHTSVPIGWLLTGEGSPSRSETLQGVRDEAAGYGPSLPLWAEVDCGQFVWAESFEDSGEFVSVPQELHGSGRFVLRARGDSMADEILDGDGCVFRRVPDDHQPRDGQIVVAQLTGDSEGSTIKRYFDRGECVVLRPHNPSYDTILLVRKGRAFAHNRGRVQLLIKGVLVGLVRQYR